jgi:PhnB protein
MVRAVPEGYHTVTPYLNVEGCAAALEFYKKAFGAEETVRMPGPGGKIMHAEMRIGDSMIMLSDATPEHPASSVLLCLYVEDCDALFHRAIAAGAKQLRPLEDQFYGDRSGMVADPFGQHWGIMTHKEDVSPEEMERRMRQMGQPGNG